MIKSELNRRKSWAGCLTLSHEFPRIPRGRVSTNRRNGCCSLAQNGRTSISLKSTKREEHPVAVTVTQIETQGSWVCLFERERWFVLGSDRKSGSANHRIVRSSFWLFIRPVLLKLFRSSRSPSFLWLSVNCNYLSNKRRLHLFNLQMFLLSLEQLRHFQLKTKQIRN